MELIEIARKVLRDSDYQVRTSPDLDSILYFEDESLFGLLKIVPTAEVLIEEWKKLQQEFLQHNANKIREANQKAWNVYLILLAEAEGSDRKEKGELADIEENFQGARKIARARIRTKVYVVEALLPLLPIQRLAEITSERPLERLTERVQAFDQDLLTFLGDTDTEVLVSDLLEEEAANN